MTVLRSREIVPLLPPNKTTPKRLKTTHNPNTIDPSTPSQTKEPSPSKQPTPKSSVARRRSLRIAGIMLDPAGASSASESPDITRRVRRRTVRASASAGPSEPRASGSAAGGEIEMGDEAKGRMEEEEADERGKRKMQSEDEAAAAVAVASESDSDSDSDGEGGGRFSRKEKGKAKMVEDSLEEPDRGEVEPEEVNGSDGEVLGDPQQMPWLYEYRKRSFRAQAQRSAAYFAHFTDKDELYTNLAYSEAVLKRGEVFGSDEDSDKEPEDTEDWPGPFSTALKIIEDREKKRGQAGGKSSSAKDKAADVKWVPGRREMAGPGSLRDPAPSLVELCLKLLAENAERLDSLDYIPEELTHRLCQLLCDGRRMDARIFELLVQGSPMELRLSDCSWCSELEFVEVLKGFDPSCLRVLKLDHSGRCLPDYVLHDTLAKSKNFLPQLHTLSLKGACRLSDAGIKTLASSAPALRSLNLSQCSLLTHVSIDTLANCFGPKLKELCLEDCQGIDAMLMLPALMRFQQLESLSVAGIKTVCHEFISQFVSCRRDNLKELILTGCTELTDDSMKAIAKNCPGLRSLDIAFCKFPDSSLGHLANGCRSIQRLILCRNPFSDKSIAAFMETSGECLEELSLNNVRKVGFITHTHNPVYVKSELRPKPVARTHDSIIFSLGSGLSYLVGCYSAISIARNLGKLQKLDLSWCRNVTNNALGLVVDSCRSLRVLKLFGCTQITDEFLEGHSNLGLEIIGVEMTPLLKAL